MATKMDNVKAKLESIDADLSILLGTWLRGEHLEDLAHIHPGDIPGEDRLIEELKKGLNLVEIAKLNPTRRLELIKLTQESSDVFYKLTLADLIRTRVRKEFKADKITLDELTTEMNFANGLVDDDADVDAVTHLGQELLEELKRRKAQKTIPFKGLPTLTKWMGGIKRQALTTIAARPGVGKSALGLQLALGAYEAGEKVLYFPLEMSAVQLAERLLEGEGIATSSELMTADFKDEAKFDKAINTLDAMSESKKFLIFEGAGCSRIETIEAKIKQLHPGVVVIDQLSLMRSRSKTFREPRMQFTFMTSELKRIAMAYNVAILLMAQINRGAETDEPKLSNLKESGSIEEDSDNVIMIHQIPVEAFDRPELIPWETSQPCIIKLEKHRSGRTGKFNALFFPEKTRFGEPDNRIY